MRERSICVLGGTGFVGKQVVSRLAAQGHSVKLLTRRRERHRELLVLPGVSILETDVYDQNELTKRLVGCDAGINLVGILNERGHSGKGFRKTHVDLPLNFLRACEQHRVTRVLHMSALNADPDGPSHYLRTKGEAENQIHTLAGNRIQVTSFRPSVIFGEGDSFLNRFAALLKLTPGIFPLACADARFAPVYVGDVADFIVNALEDKSTYGQRYDLCGPHEYTLRQLVEFTAKMQGLERTVIGLPGWLSKLQASVFEFVPGKPFSLDNYNSLSRDSVCEQGITCTTSLESIAPLYLGNADRESRMQHFRTEYWAKNDKVG